jgi:dihydroxy-acid dehydratase
MTPHNGSKLRGQAWWDNSEKPAMTALYLERLLNDGLTREQLQSGRPIIGIARTGSDLVPCNRHHLVLFVVTGGEREGLRTARVHPGN